MNALVVSFQTEIEDTRTANITVAGKVSENSQKEKKTTNTLEKKRYNRV